MKQIVEKTRKHIRDISQKVPLLTEREKQKEQSLKLGEKEWDKILGNVPVFL